MNKMQKMGFSVSAGVFLFLGIVFLLIGYLFNNEVLWLMGLIGTPLAVLNLILILVLIKKAK